MFDPVFVRAVEIGKWKMVTALKTDVIVSSEDK